MVKLDEKDLYQLLIAEFRYAIRRDNHLAPGTCMQHIANYLPEMSKQWRAHTAKQLTEEIIQERIWLHSGKPKLDYDHEWEGLQRFLVGYLDAIPYNADKYMDLLFQKPDRVASIDYYSTEVHNKIAENIAKK